MKPFWILSQRPYGNDQEAFEVAPCGELRHRKLVVLSNHMAGSWSVLLGAPPLAGVAFVGPDHAEPRSLWSVPRTSRHRPILLASPSTRSHLGLPLAGPAGQDLARVSGLPLSSILESFECRNLSHFVDATPAERRHAAERFLGELGRTTRPIVVLRADSARALETAAGNPVALREQLPELRVVDHPSGRAILGHAPERRRELRAALVAALCRARGADHHETWPAAVAAAAEGRRGDWSWLRRAGVVAPSRRLLDNWELGDVHCARRMVGGHLAVVRYPEGWSASTTRGDRVVVRPGYVEDLEDAVLLAELQGREQDLRDPWDVQDDRLSLRSGESEVGL